jgi:hypothetical protein
MGCIPPTASGLLLQAHEPDAAWHLEPPDWNEAIEDRVPSALALFAGRWLGGSDLG